MTSNSDPHAALNQHLHGDGDTITAGSCLITSAAEAAVAIWRTRALVAEADVERLKRALVEAAIPLEAMILATQDDPTGRRFYGDMWDGIVAGAKAARAALAKGGPDDR